VLSLAVAWQNTRYVARRLERLAGPIRAQPERRSALGVVKEAARPGVGSATDEIDSIERTVDRLSDAMTAAEAGIREREAAATRRTDEYAALLAETSAAVSRQLDEVRLPIHILLQSTLRPPNENPTDILPHP